MVNATTTTVTTPGPWTCHSGMVWAKGPRGEIPIAHMDRDQDNGTTPSERDANALLCAAAPDLEAVVQRTIHELSNSDPSLTTAGSLWKVLRDDLLAAIDNAEEGE